MARATFSVAEPGSQGAYMLVSTQPGVVDDVKSEIRFRRCVFLASCGIRSGIEGDRQPFGILAALALTGRAFTVDDGHVWVEQAICSPRPVSEEGRGGGVEPRQVGIWLAVLVRGDA